MQEAERFSKFKMQCVAEKKREPKADGVLVFDEVKVISRMMWNSRSQTMIGFAMSYEEMSSLMDVYQSIASDARTKMTTYIVQFLWRDLTSSFDIVGPYYTSSGTMESKFILSCVMETLKLFHLYGFKTSVLLCDGASTNLCTIKATMGTSGAFGMGPNVNKPHEVQDVLDDMSKSSSMCAIMFMWVNSGFIVDCVCTCVCACECCTRILFSSIPSLPSNLVSVSPSTPSPPFLSLPLPTLSLSPSFQQLKNQINALFSSRPGGTKSFNLDGIDFGWQAIQGMFARECERRDAGKARMVPKLRETHVIRDSWTKLNVSPAKIMQVYDLSSLYMHVVFSSIPKACWSNKPQSFVVTKVPPTPCPPNVP